MSNTTDIFIGGGFSSSEYNYIQVSLLRWKNQSYWKSASQINDAINSLQIGVAFSEYYFDSNDYSNPIKINVNIDNFVGLMASYDKIVKLKLKRNELVDNKYILPFFPSNKYTYFSFGKISTDLTFEDSDAGEIFQLKIDLDTNYQSVSRTVFTLGDMFGMIGGMDSILYIIALLFVRIFSSKIYIISLISSFYFVRSEQENPTVYKPRTFEEERKDSVINLNQDQIQFDSETPNAWISNQSKK